MIGPRHLDKGFLQRIKDLSLKGGSLYMAHFLTRERLHVRPKFQKDDYKYEDYSSFTGPFYPMDSRELYFEHVTDVLGHQHSLAIPPEEGGCMAWLPARPTLSAIPTCTRPGYPINGPLFMLVPTPQYNVDGVEAMEDKAKWDEYMRVALSQVVDNLESDNLVQIFSDGPWGPGVPQHWNDGRLMVRNSL